MRMNTIFGNKIITALILTLLIFATGAPASARAGATVAPAVLGFGSQTVGTASMPALVTFSNNTKSNMKIVGASLSQIQFTYSGPTLPITLSPGQAFTGSVTFSPTGAQAYSDTLRFTRANGTTETSSLTGTGVQSGVPGGSVIPPTSLLLTVAPCDSNFNCVAGTADAVSQWVRITAHVVYTGTTNPTGTLCVLDNGSPANCGLTPAADENWFVNSLAGGTHKLSATYAGNSIYGGSTSGISTLIVGSATPPPSVVAPTITLQPVSQTVMPGKTATFSVQVTGTAPLTYQWSKSGAVIPNATSASYTTPATTLADNSAKFVLVVSNSAGTSTSSAAVLGVFPPTSLALTVAPCDSNFNCVAGTTGAVGQWVRITAHVVYTGTTNPTGTLCIMDNGSPANCGLTPAADENWFVNGLTAGTHKLSATYAGNSIYGGSTSGISTLVVGSTTSQVVAPTITLQPVSQTVAPGNTATFSVQVTGTAPLTYQWSKSGTVIPVATSASYTTPATTLSDNGAQFVLVVTNSAGTSTSTAAVLSVSSTATPLLTTNPSSLSFGNTTVGTSNTLSVALTNSGTSNVSISNTSISGAGFSAPGISGTILTPGQSATLDVTFAPSGAGTISGSVSVTSNAATAKINLSGAGIQPAMTSITVTPANQTVSVGNQVQYQAMDNLGNDVTSSVSWSSSDSSIVSISAAGLATGVANGSATVAATK